MDKQKLSEFQMGEIEAFWEWVLEHKDDVAVDFYDNEHFYLYLSFDPGMLNAFTEQYQWNCEERGCPCRIGMNGLSIPVKEIEGGYGFTMTDLWENRPEGIEDEIGENLR